MKKFRLGRPNLSKYPYCWKLRQNETDVTSAEIEQASDELDDYLCQWYNFVSENGQVELYLLGENMGDRSHYLIIRNFDLLSSLLLERLMGFLIKNPSWRIVIPTFRTRKTHIVVYYDAVLMPVEYSDAMGLDRLRVDVKNWESQYQENIPNVKQINNDLGQEFLNLYYAFARKYKLSNSRQKPREIFIDETSVGADMIKIHVNESRVLDLRLLCRLKHWVRTYSSRNIEVSMGRLGSVIIVTGTDIQYPAEYDYKGSIFKIRRDMND